MNTITTRLTALGILGLAALGLAGCSSTTPIAQATVDCEVPLIFVGDEGRTLSFDMEGEDPDSGNGTVEQAVCLLNELDAPDSLVSKMSKTTAMDGTQTDTFEHYDITWSYHPSRGLDFVIEPSA